MYKTFLVMILSSMALASAQSLENTCWNLAYHWQGDRFVQTLPGSAVTAEFAKGRISGYGGCNGFGGTYTQAGEKLTFRPLVRTLRACADDAVTAQEGTYLQTLEQVRSFKLERGVLQLKDGAGRTLLIFAQARPEAIRRGEWTVTAINTKEAIVSVLENTRPTATFGANGRVSGNTGCNQYSAPYTLEGFNLKIGPAVSTRRACVNEEANRQEMAFLRALEGVSGFRITGDRLELYGADGRILVNLSR